MNERKLNGYKELKSYNLNIKIGSLAEQYANETLDQIVIFTCNVSGQDCYGYRFVFKSGRHFENYGTLQFAYLKAEIFDNLMYFLREKAE